MTAYFWTTDHFFPHSWNVVTKHFWSRYPNPNSSHVFSEDLIECGLDADGILRTKKLIIKTNKLPWWGKHLFSARRVAVIEETQVDARNQTMTTYTRNIGLRIFMGTTEKNVYRPCEGSAPGGDQPQTVCEKNVWIESDIVGLRSAIKKFGLDRFKVNCVLASDGLEWAIQRGQLHTAAAAVSKPAQQLQSMNNNSLASVPRANFMSTGNSLAN